MLFGRLTHPEILVALAKAGHNSRVMVADGNYPVATESSPAASKVFLNLRRGLVTVSDVLKVLVETIPIQSAMLMEGPDGNFPPIHAEYKELLPAGIEFTLKKRADFYAEVKSTATALVIATGDERRFANIIITLGVVASDKSPKQ
jgi:L-fucose mutarotase